MQTAHPARSPLVGGVLLGVGIGGFFDGIVFHQILQWHHMVTSAGYPPDSVANLQFNTLWDGLFHAGAWLFTLAGLWLLWRSFRHRDGQMLLRWHPGSTAFLAGCLLLGWGLFNLAEGLVNHHLLGLHHVREGPHHEFWDIAFLIWGAAMAAAGWALIGSARQRLTTPTAAERVETARVR